LHYADIEREVPLADQVDLILAALVFEYVDVPKAARNIVRRSRLGTILGTLLQLPSHSAAVSTSPYSSLQRLGSIMRPVSPLELRHVAEAAGFLFMAERTIELASGKRFAHQIFSAKAEGLLFDRALRSGPKRHVSEAGASKINAQRTFVIIPADFMIMPNLRRVFDVGHGFG
jgi:hypothetical protein